MRLAGSCPRRVRISSTPPTLTPYVEAPRREGFLLVGTTAIWGELPTPDDTFAPNPDAIFICTARSIRWLFAAVDAEHHGYFTEVFANQKLRENPALVAAAKADAASCDKGRYIGAMYKALRAEEAEAERLKGLLKGK